MYRKAQTTLTIMLILFSALLWAAKPAHAMRRESALEPDLIIQPADLYTALDISLAVGDGRKVDFAPFGLGW